MKLTRRTLIAMAALGLPMLAHAAEDSLFGELLSGAKDAAYRKFLEDRGTASTTTMSTTTSATPATNGVASSNGATAKKRAAAIGAIPSAALGRKSAARTARIGATTETTAGIETTAAAMIGGSVGMTPSRIFGIGSSTV